MRHVPRREQALGEQLCDEIEYDDEARCSPEEPSRVVRMSGRGGQMRSPGSAAVTTEAEGEQPGVNRAGRTQARQAARQRRRIFMAWRACGGMSLVQDFCF